MHGKSNGLSGQSISRIDGRATKFGTDELCLAIKQKTSFHDIRVAVHSNSDLMSISELNDLSHKGILPITVAILYDRLDVVKYLCSKGADLNILDLEKRRPLFFALTLKLPRDAGNAVRTLLTCGAIPYDWSHEAEMRN